MGGSDDTYSINRREDEVHEIEHSLEILDVLLELCDQDERLLPSLEQIRCIYDAWSRETTIHNCNNIDQVRTDDASDQDEAVEWANRVDPPTAYSRRKLDRLGHREWTERQISLWL